MENALILTAWVAEKSGVDFRNLCRANAVVPIYRTVVSSALPPLHLLRTLGIEPSPNLLKLFVRKRLAKGAVALRAGDIWSEAWAVEAGILRMYFLRKDGREFNKSFHMENAFIIPITPAMQTQPSIFHVAAVEECVVWSAPAMALTTELQKHGQWNPLQNHLLSQLLTGKLIREHDLLTLDARRRYKRLCTEQPDLVRRVPLSMLASYLGITDVSLSRIRRTSKQE